MDATPNIARFGSLLGDNTRAGMLSTLMHGKALTALELVTEAGVTAQTASTHIAKLESAGLLVIRKQGRHKYFALASENIASLLEQLMSFTADRDSPIVATGPRDTALRHARVCYNHMAGAKGIQLFKSLVANGHLAKHHDSLGLSASGESFMRKFGIDLDALNGSRTPLCRECLDWSERRSHLAGSLGRALLARLQDRKWVKISKQSRVLVFSPRGEREFNTMFPAPTTK